MNKKLVSGIALVVVGVLAVVAFDCRKNTKAIRTIAVNGECMTTAPKDRTAITLRVTTLDKNADTSMKMATSKIAEITAYLKNQDVKMQTTQFDSYEKTQWDSAAQKSVVMGIETNIALEVSADNIETIEKILGQFAGQQNVYSENLRMFTSSDTLKPIMEDCLGRAVENARARANALAAGDGLRAGKMLNIEYGASSNSIVRPTTNYMLRAAKVASEMDVAYAAGGIVAQDSQITVSVSAVFEIK